MIIAKCIRDSEEDLPILSHDLTVGNLYEVERIDMGQSHTDVYLKDKDIPYNSIFFKFYETKDLNIYKDPRFNPYLR